MKKLLLETKNKLQVKIEELRLKNKCLNLFRSVVKGKPIPCGSGLTPEYD
jgi:hypothetical protein